MSTPVCPNCQQWQHPTSAGYYDCCHECVRRGFAPKTHGPALSTGAPALGPVRLSRDHARRLLRYWHEERGDREFLDRVRALADDGEACHRCGTPVHPDNHATVFVGDREVPVHRACP